MNSIENNFANVNELYKRLSSALADASDELIDKNGQNFWVKYHGYGLYRICYIINDHYFDLKQKEYSGNEIFKVFELYDHVRDFYQYKTDGRNQLNILKSNSSITLKTFEDLSLCKPKKKHFNTKEIILRKGKKFLNFLVYILSFIRPTKTLVMRSSMSKFDKFKLFIFSRLQVTPFFIDFPKLKSSPDNKLRIKLLELVRNDIQKHYDHEFTDYIIKVLFVTLPTSTVEDFSYIKSCFLDSHLASIKNKYILNESITSDHQVSIVSALAGKFFKTELIYHEHNKITKAFKFNTLFIIEGLIDRFYTHGWEPSEKNPKFFRSSSTWPGFKSKGIKKDIKRWALYVTGVGFLYETEFSNSSLSHSAQYLENYLTQRDDIFCSMEQNLLEHIDYKPYSRSPWDLTADIDTVAYKHKLKILSTNSHLSKISKNYELIIIDYLSTSHIEIMISNQPVLVLWNGPVNEPNDEAKPYVDDLFQCGVFHRTGKSLGYFAQNIKGNEQAWWNSDEVTQPVKRFLGFYINNNDDLIHQIVNL